MSTKASKAKAGKAVKALRLDKDKTSGPHHITKDSWFYAEEKSLCVVAELRNSEGDYLGTTIAHIPWAKVSKVTPRAAKARE